MMRVVLFSPTGKSIYARMVLHLLAQEPGVEVAGVVIRSIWSWRRLRGDLRRDGPRLMRKIYAKLVLGEQAYAPQDHDSLVWHLREAGLEGQSLKRICRARGIACISVRDLNSAKVGTFLKDRETDLVVFTGGGLIRRNILALPRLGVLNCHAGLLPRYRGMDVVEWAILEAQAEPETGLTLHFMDPGVDTGPILLKEPMRARAGEDLARLRTRMEERMPFLVLEGVRGLKEGRLKPTIQVSEEGRQYFVIHPRLRRAAERRLAAIRGP